MKAPTIEESIGQKVVKDNALIQKARTNLTLFEQKLVNYLISMVRPDDEEFKSYDIRVVDFARMVGVDAKHAYRDFKTLVDGIDNKAFWYEDDELLTKIHWVITPQYWKKKGIVTLRLDPILKSYLLNLRERFTEYELYNILSLKYKYSVRIYELLRSFQYRGYVVYSLQDLKALLCIDEEAPTYKKFTTFRKNVLDKSIPEINAYTDLTVTCEYMDKNKEIIEDTRKSRKAVEYISFRLRLKEPGEQFAVYSRYKKTLQPRDGVPGQMEFNENGSIYET